MSVAGEFRRSLGNYLEYLHRLEPPESSELAERLRAAEARAGSDLAAAAKLVLEQLDDGSAGADEGADGRALSEHLIAICRVVVGR